MELIHHNLFDSALLDIRHAVARPPDSDVAYAVADVMLLPITGFFAKHDNPGHHFIANANHGLFFGRGKPYRITFPSGMGDESLVIRFSPEAQADLLAGAAGIDDLSSPGLDRHCLLSPSSMLDRDRLLAYLSRGGAMPLVIEELCIAIFAASVKAACNDGRRKQRVRATATALRRRQQAEAVKEAISLFPDREWTLDSLADIAHTSPFHLARIFRDEVGLPIYQYLLRIRLGKALEIMRIAGVGLTDVALEAGFSSHSHFSSSFRALFGITPSRFIECVRRI